MKPDADTLNIHSRNMTGGISRMPNRAMLRAIGFSDEDFGKPIVGVASAGSEVSPCNVHLDDLAAIAKVSIRHDGGVPLKFNTFVVTDGNTHFLVGFFGFLPRFWVIFSSVSEIHHAGLRSFWSLTACSRSFLYMVTISSSGGSCCCSNSRAFSSDFFTFGLSRIDPMQKTEGVVRYKTCAIALRSLQRLGALARVPFLRRVWF